MNTGVGRQERVLSARKGHPDAMTVSLDHRRRLETYLILRATIAATQHFAARLIGSLSYRILTLLQTFRLAECPLN